MLETRTPELSIFLYSDEPICQLGLRAALASDSDIIFAGICSNPSELMAASARHQPHVVVYSLNLDPELSVVAELRRTAPGTSVVLLGRDFTPEVAHHGIELGVRGFLNTTASPDAVRECIRHCATGQLWMERQLYNSLLDARPVPLSRRQTELLGLLIQGLKNREIAAAMGISEGTVKAYLTKLFEKVGARDRFELALYGLKHLRTAPEAGLGRDARRSAQKRSAATFVA